MSSFGRLGRLFCLAAGLAGFVPAAATAAEAASEWVRNDQAAVRLISAVTATGESDQLRLGLEFDLAPGWKVYWRSAGDAGYPPSIEWQGDGLASAELLWPMPFRFEVMGLQNLGYQKHVVYPVAATLREPGQPLQLRAEVDYLTCSEICVPQRATLDLVLPSGPAQPSPHAQLINRYETAVPGSGEGHGLRLERLEAGASANGGFVRATVHADPPLRAPDIFVETAEDFTFLPPTVRLSQGGRVVVLETVAPNAGAAALLGQPLTVTVGEGMRGLEQRLEAQPGSAGAGLGESGALLLMLGMALVGGLILNLMPCVLPVLSIKVLGLIGHGGAERRQIRLSFVASSAGIVVSFLLLAAAAVAVKAAGMAVGWGIQFQQPLFLVFLSVIVTLFAANLWGLFEVPMPYWLSGVGGGHGQPHSLPGHFLTGAFATLLATPCTAPFLGTAIGFALGHGPVEIFAIFAALGVGMALPYLAVAAWPGLAQRLPRPGRWMITVRKVMALALAATAVWLVSVLWAQTGLTASAAVAGMLLAMPLLLALRLRLSGAARGAMVAGVALLAAGAFVPPLQATSGDPREAARDLHWVAFERDAISGLVGDGRVVLIDVTADWCITCQVNKTAVLNRGKVAELVRGGGVVAMRADWTRPDEGIAAYLASFGRYGIPFNAVYGPGAPDGIALPELLTEGIVMDAIERAGRARPQAEAATR